MQSLKEKMKEFDNMLLRLLLCYGFKKKRQHLFVRKQGDCLQHISILETKVRGKSQVHIMVFVGFQFEKVDKVIYFIQNEKYDAKWGTGNINIGALMDTKIPYGFYLNEDTALEPVVQNIFQAIERYALGFWESCDTMDKYEKKLLDKDRIIVISTVALKRPEWNELALAILLGHRSVEEVFEEHAEEFKRNLSLFQIAQERIKQYNVLKEVGI